MKAMTSVKFQCLLCVWMFGSMCLTVGSENDTDWKRHYLYFEEVDINCSSSALDAVVEWVQFWILPSGEILRPSDTYRDHHVTLVNNGFQLTIDRLDDPDFGIYYCIVKSGPNSTDVIKVGINVDGPYYGEELFARYKRNAIIGGIAAGVVFVIMITFWVLYSNITCTEANAKLDEETGEKNGDVPNGSANQENQIVNEHDKLDGWVQSTKIGDSIYDSADGIRSAKLPDAPPSIDHMGQHGDRLLSTDSGHYQTIGSLERDQKLISESEIDEDDVKILKTVIRRDWSETSGEVLHDGTTEPDAESGRVNANDSENTCDSDSKSKAYNDGPLDEVEYSVSTKMYRNKDRKDDKETVVIIDGDVIIEPMGTAVMVTTVSTTQQTESQPKDNVVAQPDVAANNAKKLNVIVAPVVQQNDMVKTPEEGNPSEIPKRSATDTEIDNGARNSPATESATQEEVHVATSTESNGSIKEQRKISSSSSSKAEGDSSTSSVDENTISKFQNVLASLISKHSKTGSNVSGHSVGSRSTSADSNVFHEDDPGSEPKDDAVEDVHL